MSKPQKSKWIKIFWIVFGSGFGVILLLFFLISMGWMGFMPSFTDLENPQTNLASEVYSADGELLGKYYIENRSNCHYNDLSPELRNALIATEDARFYRHAGIDFRAMGRVFFGVLTFSNKGGGSTITQQLAKNLFPRDADAGKIQIILTKMKEWVVACKLEHEYSKDEILAMYFNTVDFGNQSLGIKSAAATYFNKEPIALNAQESALLVGMLKAPSKYSPIRNPNNAMTRRNTVLNQMERYGYLTEQQADSIKDIAIDMSKFSRQDHISGNATYFREYLRQYLKDWCKNNPKKDGSFYNVDVDGLRIYTTIDSRIQKYAEQAVYEHICDYLQPIFFKHWSGYKNAPFYNLGEKDTRNILVQAMRRSDRYACMKDEGFNEEQIIAEFQKKVKMKIFTYHGLRDTIMSPWDSLRYMKTFLHCGFMAMETNTGYVRAYVGGVNYQQFQYDHVKLSKRQVGSTFKPYVYAVAMQNGYDPCTMVPNVPVTFAPPDVNAEWTPKNSGHYREGEMIPLREALAMSVNQVSAYLMKEFKPQSVIQLVQAMGIKSEIPAVPAICLGACELTLYEQVGAINCFPNQGVYVEPTFITKICDKEGNVIASFAPSTKQAINPITAFKTVKLMQGVVDYGTSARLRGQYKLSFPLGGKTGTTDNQSDAWFVGYSPMLTCGVWVGCEDRAAHFRSMEYGQGARMAMPVFGLFMQKLYNDPKLPYNKVIKEPNKHPGYSFPVPDNYTGDAGGCNGTTDRRTNPNFD
ncbi:MAG: transglycosylase domain-containing protein [Bacteroidales bacterium]|jgi:penicillin-binding protein 1A|nr:transglycosylase domain-containing protein [Bacteroidales bacterium]